MLPHNASDPLLFLVPTSNAQRPTWCAPRNHSCHPILALGGVTADNCFFGAPPLMDALMDELGRQRDLGGRPFRWMTVGQPELGIAHVAQAVGVPIGEQCTREVLHYMFDNESSGSRVA